MNISEQEYARVGRAVIDRMRAVRNAGSRLVAVPGGQLVKSNRGGVMQLSISVPSCCFGCGLRLEIGDRGGILTLEFEEDPLHVRELAE